MRQFVVFCGSVLHVVPSASTEVHCLLWIKHLFDSTAHQSSTLIGLASALNAERRARGWSTFMQSVDARALIKAIRKSRPQGLLRRVAARSLSQLFESAPRGEDFRSVRDRAILGLRLVALLRPSAPLDIDASSITDTFTPHGARVVTFLLRTKSARAQGISTDSNNVEFLSRPSPFLFLCPATNLLALRDMVRRLAEQRGEPMPSSLMVDETLASLSRSRVSSIVRDCIRRAGAAWSDVASRDLRAFSNQALALAGVPEEQIAVRGGWSSSVSAVRVRHYSSFRFTRVNFADVIFGSRQFELPLGGEVVPS